jgi:hypothetical protein
MILKGVIKNWHDGVFKDAKDLIALKKDPKEQISLKNIEMHHFIKLMAIGI